MAARRLLWMAPVIAIALLGAGSAAYAAGMILHGRGELVSQPLTGDLEVLDARLEPMLLPGATGNLILSVRNRSAADAVADRVRLLRPLRDVQPAGCLAAVSGPLLDPGGVSLAGLQRVTIRAGRTGEVVVPAALALAATAKNGCGFRVQVDIQAIQLPPKTMPPSSWPTTDPTWSPTAGPTDPTSTPTAGPGTDPTTIPTPWPGTDPTTVPTGAPPTTSPTTQPSPPPMPTLDCDELDPGCGG
jgi:hypothetical protein